jgi:hypothetical protein
MTDGFSRRSWLQGMFSVLAGLIGVRQRATAAPAVPRPESTAPPPLPPVQSYAYHEGPLSSVSVTTYTCDGKVTRRTEDPHFRVTTYTYFYDA